ncbi:energy transducer TonB [Oxalobacteraceae bacterium R-40]|uniref:Energy transducer TonB n=1 Tax=Keguizhuia sedimenti TaxID=3064264 RepID=A0ABU1BJ53_9BURK|nr:energy transducer TonB [Oxalobacteraceae bacterium R-40]
MQTIASSASFDHFLSSRPLKKIGPLSLIISLHIAFFLLVQSNLFHPTVQASAAPKEVIASFITPDPQPVPEVAQPVRPKPKTVPIVKKTSTPVKRLPPATKPVPMQEPESAPAEAEATPQPAAVSAPSTAVAHAAPPAIAVPKTISGVEYIQAPRPEYPPLSKRMGEEGKVLLRVLINEKGRPEKIELQRSSGFDRLDEAARQSALRAVFKPHMEDGRPVAVYTTIPIDFQLNK